MPTLERAIIMNLLAFAPKNAPKRHGHMARSLPAAIHKDKRSILRRQSLLDHVLGMQVSRQVCCSKPTNCTCGAQPSDALVTHFTSFSAVYSTKSACSAISWARQSRVCFACLRGLLCAEQAQWDIHGWRGLFGLHTVSSTSAVSGGCASGAASARAATAAAAAGCGLAHAHARACCGG
eukprot:1139060-Pelagomonas_calceolata.AAC.10